MNIVNDTKLDFDDVLIVPQRSKAASRSNVDVDRQLSFYHSDRIWRGVPIMVANMDTTGTLAMADALRALDMVTCLHKHYDLVDYKNIKSVSTDWVTIGIKDRDIDKLENIIELIHVVPNICIDVANGYTDDFVNFCSKVRNRFGTSPIIMAGNVCTPEMVQELILHGGIDIVKVGIGPGSACTTRLKTGIGYPQLSAISECAHAAHGLKKQDRRLGLICADGGCRTPADVVKAFAANADFVMLGGMLAGTEECEGEWEYEYQRNLIRYSEIDQYKDTINWLDNTSQPNENSLRRKKSLTFYGMSSHKAQEKYGGIKDYRASEGRVVTVPYKGYAKEIMLDILGGIRSACAYTGATCLKDLPKCAEFIRVNRTHFDRTT